MFNFCNTQISKLNNFIRILDPETYFSFLNMSVQLVFFLQWNIEKRISVQKWTSSVKRGELQLIPLRTKNTLSTNPGEGVPVQTQYIHGFFFQLNFQVCVFVCCVCVSNPDAKSHEKTFTFEPLNPQLILMAFARVNIVKGKVSISGEACLCGHWSKEQFRHNRQHSPIAVQPQTATAEAATASLSVAICFNGAARYRRFDPVSPHNSLMLSRARSGSTLQLPVDPAEATAAAVDGGIFVRASVENANCLERSRRRKVVCPRPPEGYGAYFIKITSSEGTTVSQMA